MILTFAHDTMSTQALRSLCSKEPQGVFDFYNIPEEIDFEALASDKTLILLDLSANGTIQNLLSPSIIAETLHRYGLLQHINTIKILIADILPEKPISVFAWELSQSILEIAPSTSILIQLAIDIEENPTLIEPPIKASESDWTVYSLSSDRKKPPESTKQCFEFYKHNTSCVLFRGGIDAIFGENIQVDPETIRKTYGIKK